jgi:hypothetical protein
MPISEIHVCQCADCIQQEGHPNKQLHQQMNLLLSRLDEQQRRWYVAVEANRIGHGGLRLLSLITGMNEKTINADNKKSSKAWQSAQAPESVSVVEGVHVLKKRLGYSRRFGKNG